MKINNYEDLEKDLEQNVYEMEGNNDIQKNFLMLLQSYCCSVEKNLILM